jgi:hypothetical protein
MQMECRRAFLGPQKFWVASQLRRPIDNHLGPHRSKMGGRAFALVCLRAQVEGKAIQTKYLSTISPQSGRLG